MFEQAFKNIDGVLWKEAGCTTDRIEAHGRRGKALIADYVLVYRNLYAQAGIPPTPTIRNSRMVQSAGSRDVARNIAFYTP